MLTRLVSMLLLGRCPHLTVAQLAHMLQGPCRPRCFVYSSGTVRAFGSGPAGQHAAVGTLSPSDCYPAGPAGTYVAGGPVGPDVSFIVLEPLEHSVLTRLAGMLLLGCCPRLTVTLLAQLACVSQRAMLAQMIIYRFWNR